DALIQNLDHQTHHLIGEMQEHVKNEFILQTQLDKLAQVGAAFPEFASVYKEACQALAKHLTNYVNNAKGCLDNYSFKEMRKNLESLVKALSLQSHLVSLFDIKQEISNLETQLLMCLRKLTDEGLGVIKKAIKDESNFHKEEKDDTFSFVQIEKLGKSDIEQLETSAAILENAVNVFELPFQHVNLDKSIKQVFQSFLGEVVVYFERISQKIASLFEKQRYQAFDEIKGFVFVMDNLRKIKAVEQRTQRSYFQIIERIFGYVRDVHKDIELMLPLLMKQDLSFDYNRLFECIGCMNRSKWIEERQEGRGDNLMDAIKEKLMLHLCELKQSSTSLELDIDHPDHLEQGRKIVEHLEKLNRLESIIPEITNYHKEVGMKIEHAIRATVSTIEHEFSLERKNVHYQKEIKEQLKKLKVYTESLNHANAYLQQKKLKNAQELDSRIQSIENEIKMNNTDFEKEKNNFDKEIQRVNEEISKLMDIKQSYQQLAIKKNRRDKNIPQKAIDFLKKQGYQSIEQIEEQENRADIKSETLQEKKQELEKTQTQHIKKLDKNLKEYQQIQKEFQQLQQKEKVILKTASKFLKSRDWKI
ncbi:hypothetical protein RFI_36812, partial [Reticulomyxa filosa]